MHNTPSPTWDKLELCGYHLTCNRSSWWWSGVWMSFTIVEGVASLFLRILPLMQFTWFYQTSSLSAAAASIVLSCYWPNIVNTWQYLAACCEICWCVRSAWRLARALGCSVFRLLLPTQRNAAPPASLQMLESWEDGMFSVLWLSVEFRGASHPW